MVGAPSTASEAQGALEEPSGAPPSRAGMQADNPPWPQPPVPCRTWVGGVRPAGVQHVAVRVEERKQRLLLGGGKVPAAAACCRCHRPAAALFPPPSRQPVLHPIAAQISGRLQQQVASEVRWRSAVCKLQASRQTARWDDPTARPTTAPPQLPNTGTPADPAPRSLPAAGGAPPLLPPPPRPSTELARARQRCDPRI